MGDVLCASEWDDGVISPGLVSETLEEYVQRVAGTGGVGGAEYYEIITAFPHTLLRSPVDAAGSKLFVNGQKQKYGTHFLISSNTASWLGYTLKPGWTIELYYR